MLQLKYTLRTIDRDVTNGLSIFSFTKIKVQFLEQFAAAIRNYDHEFVYDALRSPSFLANGDLEQPNPSPGKAQGQTLLMVCAIKGVFIRFIMRVCDVAYLQDMMIL